MESKNIRAEGQVRYGNTNIVVDIPKGIVEYYYSLIPKYLPKARQMYDGHITIIRTGVETWPKSITVFDGIKVQFFYEPIINYSPPYYFLNCWSRDIVRIRHGLGLTSYRPFFNSYHITIGNTKNEL